jgi:hypothetical protein
MFFSSALRTGQVTMQPNIPSKTYNWDSTAHNSIPEGTHSISTSRQMPEEDLNIANSNTRVGQQSRREVQSTSCGLSFQLARHALNVNCWKILQKTSLTYIFDPLYMFAAQPCCKHK